MANIDELLKIATRNKEEETPEFNDYEVEELKQTFHIRGLNRKERNEVTFKTKINADTDLESFVKSNYKYIYKCVKELKETALRAKEQGLITRYEDIIELLFEAPRILAIWNYIVDISNFQSSALKEDVDEIKK